MFNFLKNLFKPKSTNVYKHLQSSNQTRATDNSHCILIDNSQIEKEKENELKILKVFGDNLSLFHRIVVPLFSFVKELNIGVFEYSNLIKKGYVEGNINTLAKYVKSINDKCRNDITTKFCRTFGEEIAEEFVECLFEECAIPFFELSYASGESLAELQASFKKILLNERTQYASQDFLKEQLKIFFIKLFTYEAFVKNVDNNDELTKILINASYKYQDIEVISDETYELFLEYTNLNTNNFPLSYYYEFISVYVAIKNACREFYSDDEIQLDFEYKTNNISEIIEKVIETKAYQNFDVDKLVLSLLYHKVKTYTNVSMLIKELENIKTYISKIKKARTKYDLLNNNYNSKQTTISDIDLMNGIEFEKFLCKLLTKLNFACENTKASGDQGVDIIATKDNNKIAIQAKCYSQPVGNHAVMEAIAGAKYYNANQCMVITNSTFTKAAKELANANGVVLWDRKILIEKLKEY